MKIGTRLNLVLGLLMVIIISSLGIYTILTQKGKILTDTDLRMNEQVEDLSKVIEADLKKSRENVNRALIIGKTLMERDGGMRKDGDAWSIGGSSLESGSDFVDEVNRLSGAAVSIFMKQGNEYIRISTTVKIKKVREKLEPGSMEVPK
ncbi:MAG: hypothetical protein HC905_31160 [Bacteroidales bacterium]|nr:hypothetical protein [Bacteroidales bacterium]